MFIELQSFAIKVYSSSIVNVNFFNVFALLYQIP